MHRDEFSLAHIAHDLGRSYQTINYFLDVSTSQKKLEANHRAKGRYPRGSSKITDAHKKFINEWIE